MHKRIFAVAIFALSLMLAFAWGVAAQGPDPDSHEAATHDDFVPGPEPMTPDGPALPHRPNAAAMAVGQPGLSYRYVQTFGVSVQAYPTDTQHLNGPAGLFIDGSNNVYVIEDRGFRVLKYDSGGNGQLALGIGGSCYTDNYVFCSPRDVARDISGNFWVADGNRVVQYNSSGGFLQNWPPVNPWVAGNDNTRFNNVGGVAFDNVGHMFVSDNNNQRIQVYVFSGATPVYSATIGVNGVSGNDNSHFNHPTRIATDSSNRLYVADTGNNRAQQCSFAGSWSCSSIATGLNNPQGIGLDSSNNVYIADGGNGRVVRCLSGGGCAALITGLTGYGSDVVVDSAGNVYVALEDHAQVLKYDNTGALLGIFVGTNLQPYVADTTRVNTPWGIAAASDGSIYVAERHGYRLIKMNAAGAQQWAIGQAGVWGSDSAHFGAWWAGPEGNLAIDNRGRIYVPDTGNNRVQLFSASGNYSGTLGSFGTGQYQFSCPAGIAISPLNGDVYVVDKCNQRVQVFDSNMNYKTTLGTLGVTGTDNTHFNNPWGDALDAYGNLYVADSDNHRIQKCKVSGVTYICTTFAGLAGISGSDFDHLGHPLGVAVDAAGRVFVADEWNNRVQVFDGSGRYLTTIGGVWGARSGQMRAPSGIAFDAGGNVYVTDRENHRIQKFAPGVPGWEQVNIDGFGDFSNGNLHSLGSFGGQLYAGTFNSGGLGAQIWKMDDNHTWTPAITPGFGITRNIGLNHLLTFGDQLYAAVRNEYDGGSIYRTSDGSTWSPVVTAGFTSTQNSAIYRLGVFNGQLYAGTGVFSGAHGGEIWRSPSGDAGSWQMVVADALGDPNQYIIRSSAVFSGFLYFGTQSVDVTTFMTTTGGILMRTNSGDSGDWTKVTLNGFGDINNHSVSGLASFGGYLYASTSRWDASGIQVWRCQLCDGSDWATVVSNGFGNRYNWGISNLQILNGQLYLVIGNGVTGIEVWRSSTGNNGDWTQLSAGGFGNSNNISPYYNNVIIHNSSLYVGMQNNGSSVQIWELLDKQLFLPAIVR